MSLERRVRWVLFLFSLIFGSRCLHVSSILPVVAFDFVVSLELSCLRRSCHPFSPLLTVITPLRYSTHYLADAAALLFNFTVSFFVSTLFRWRYCGFFLTSYRC